MKSAKQNTTKMSIIMLIMILSIFGCKNVPDSKSDEPVSPAMPVLWTGDGGRGKSLGIIVPEGQGLSDNLSYIPSMVQGVLVANMSKYSAISVLDRVSLDKVIAETLDPTYEDNIDIVSLGHVAHVGNIMTGKIIRTSTGYTLQLNITDTTPEARTIASYSGTCTVAQLDDQTAIQKASQELLAQMGVQLTERATAELNTARTQQSINAQTTLAQGITAQRQGTVVEALSYYIQASDYDQSLVEAASRINILTANISSGNIGEDTRNEIAWRRQWIDRLREAETFFINYVKQPQPYDLLYSIDIQKGTINWQKETIDLSFQMGLFPVIAWMNQINRVIQAIKTGLQATGRSSAWEISWPERGANGGSTPFTSQTKNFTVVAELINNDEKSLGRQTITIPYGYEMRDGIISSLRQWEGIILFPAIDANSITDMLTIRIISIDGLATENAIRQKNISVRPVSQAEYIAYLYNAASAKIANGTANASDYL